jgi:hypothetical protein
MLVEVEGLVDIDGLVEDPAELDELPQAVSAAAEIATAATGATRRTTDGVRRIIEVPPRTARDGFGSVCR